MPLLCERLAQPHKQSNSFPASTGQDSCRRAIRIVDIDHVHTEWAGFLFLSVVIDVYSRRVVGWAVKEGMTSELAIRALNMALMTRKPKSVSQHSDQRSQGGFNRSLQHLNLGGVCGTTRRVDAEANGSRSDVLAWCPFASVRSVAAVLGSDCDLDDEREGGRKWSACRGR